MKCNWDHVDVHVAKGRYRIGKNLHVANTDDGWEFVAKEMVTIVSSSDA